MHPFFPGITYLISPYSHPNEFVRIERYFTAVNVSVLIVNQGINVFSPIVHWHHAAASGGLPTDAEYWAEYNLQFMRASKQAILLDIPGWRESKGVTKELAWFDNAKVKVHVLSEMKGFENVR